jgi:hypothetical protein
MKTIVTASLLTALLTGQAFAAADVNHDYQAAVAQQTTEQSKTPKADDTTQAVDKKAQTEDERWGLPRWWH